MEKENTNKISEIKINNSAKPGRGRPFEKGKSGNPSGRPKKTEEQKAIDKQIESDTNAALSMIAGKLPYMTEEVIRLYEDPLTPPSVKVRIWEASLDRVYGKAFQSVQIDTGANDVHVTTDAKTEVLSG